ncbi:MAG: class I tRNA ligase family protein [Nanoarchaeota archaeon]|nr:class I tRNA ligase family protein [Nanoarchaeota archaeon]
MVNSGNFDGIYSIEAKEKITKWIEDKKFGKKVVQYKLRDWLISRQRYWGTPIPIVYCEKCGIVPVLEKDLPVKLPKQVKFGKGNPLLTNESWVKTKCPKCRNQARREADTMDTFANSSWYFLRYTDSKNKKKIFDSKKVNYWCPIDQYIGGPEHIAMHLIYIRFYTKFLKDLGLLNFDEPALKYFTQGIVKGSDGFRMSKSRGNGVEPLETIKKYGADSLRLYVVGNSSPESDFEWDDKGMQASFRFVKKVYEYFISLKLGKTSPKMQSKLNKTVKEVTEFVEIFKHNMAIIKLRSFFDSFYGEKIGIDVAQSFLKMFHIYCPFVTEELWSKVGGKGLISLSKWPVVDEKKIDEKYEKEELLVEGIVRDVAQIKKFVPDVSKVYLYVLPKDKEIYDSNLGYFEKRLGLKVFVYSVSDKEKYDPENKSKKAKPGKPGIYLE